MMAMNATIIRTKTLFIRIFSNVISSNYFTKNVNIYLSATLQNTSIGKQLFLRTIYQYISFFSMLSNVADVK